MFEYAKTMRQIGIQQQMQGDEKGLPANNFKIDYAQLQKEFDDKKNVATKTYDQFVDDFSKSDKGAKLLNTLQEAASIGKTDEQKGLVKGIFDNLKPEQKKQLVEKFLDNIEFDKQLLIAGENKDTKKPATRTELEVNLKIVSDAVDNALKDSSKAKDFKIETAFGPQTVKGASISAAYKAYKDNNGKASFGLFENVDEIEAVQKDLKVNPHQVKADQSKSWMDTFKEKMQSGDFIGAVISFIENIFNKNKTPEQGVANNGTQTPQQQSAPQQKGAFGSSLGDDHYGPQYPQKNQSFSRNDQMSNQSITRGVLDFAGDQIGGAFVGVREVATKSFDGLKKALGFNKKPRSAYVSGDEDGVFANLDASGLDKEKAGELLADKNSAVSKLKDKFEDKGDQISSDIKSYMKGELELAKLSKDDQKTAKALDNAAIEIQKKMDKVWDEKAPESQEKLTNFKKQMVQGL